MCCWITSSPCGTESRAPNERFLRPVPAQAPPGDRAQGFGWQSSPPPLYPGGPVAALCRLAR